MSMEDTKDLIRDLLLSQRFFTPSTLKTYVSLLYGVYKKVGHGTPDQVFNDEERVIEIVDAPGKPASSRATVYSALYGVTQNPVYHKRMKELSAEVTLAYKNQKNTKKRDDVVLTMDEVRAIYRKLALKAAAPDAKQDDVVNVLIAGLMSGVFAKLPPRRLLDYTEMRFGLVGAVDDDMDDNLIFRKDDKYVMYFNKYKTAATDRAKGIMPVLDVPKQLTPFVERRMVARGGKNSYLLVNSHGDKFSPASLHARLLSIYGFGVDMLRSVYISEVHKGTPSIKVMEYIARAMGHSVDAQMLFYVKK